jgi:hypothetical protein
VLVEIGTADAMTVAIDDVILEDVSVLRSVVNLGRRARHPEQLGQLGEEQIFVGALLCARDLPAIDKFSDVHLAHNIAYPLTNVKREEKTVLSGSGTAGVPSVVK